MTNAKTTKRALLSSIVSLILCFTMLLSTTYAWFTDTVKSANNIITAGNLDIELYHSNSYITDEEVGGLTDLFTVEEGKTFLWEPGAVLWENFEVANKGTLALKYQLALNFTNATKTANNNTLANVLKVAVINGGFEGTREDAKNLSYNYSLSSFALEGKLDADKSDVYGIVIYWEPTANDNEYNVKGGLTIDLGVNLFATQLTAESDSFDNQYDANAPLPEMPTDSSTVANINSDGSASMTVNDAPSATTANTTIDAPAGTFEPTDKVEVAVETVNSLFDVNADGGVVASLDITMKVNGGSADLTDGTYYTVTTYISKGLANVTVDYIGTDGKDDPTEVDYDPASGKLTFKTNHFSDYAVYGAALAYDAKNDTALTDIEKVVEAAQQEGNALVIPEANKGAIEAAIKTLPEEDQQAVADAISAAKIGDTIYASMSEALKALKDGDTLTLLNNAVVNADTAVTITGTVVIDLNGKTLAGYSTLTGANRSLIVVNKGGDLTVKNGTVTMEHRGANMDWNNSTNALEAVSGGKLTLENVHVKNLGGSDMAYAVNIANNGGATLKTVASTIESVNYVALRIFNNADGAINVDLTKGTKLTGASSPFFVHFWTEADLGNKQAARQAYLNVNFNDTEVSRYNGSKSLVRFGFTNAIYYSSTAMTEVVAGNADALIWALAAGKKVVFANDITMKAETTNGYGVTGIVVDGQTIDGNGYTLQVTGAGTTWDSAIYAKGGTIKNLKISGAMRGVFMGAANADVYLDNVSFGTIYTFNSDGANQNYGVYISNSTMNGWTSHSDVHKEVVYTNCTFTEGRGYAFCRPYGPTQFVDCDFADGFEIEAVGKITFENCTIGGVALTADNLATLVTSRITNASVK